MREDKQTEMRVYFDSDSRNEAFARTVVAAYMARLDPTLEELADVKTAVSEAVTNCILHGYPHCSGEIELRCRICGQVVTVEVADRGVGIAQVEKAMEPMYTTRPEWERSGMGFAFMEAFMDELEVRSKLGEGTRVVMKKTIHAQ